jgi:hypothetical protein
MAVMIDAERTVCSAEGVVCQGTGGPPGMVTITVTGR